MDYLINHQTRFEYEHPAGSSHQALRLTPRDSEYQRVLSAQIRVDPLPRTQSQRTDYFGNQVTDVLIRENHHALKILSTSRVQVRSRDDILLDLSPAWETVAQQTRYPDSAGAWDAARFCFPSEQIALEGAREYAEPLITAGKPFLRLAMELTERIHEEFQYQGGVTDAYTPVSEILSNRVGVCQDFAHVGIACLRAYGLPARYVSGYLLTHPPAGQSRLVGADASHAWLSVWCPEFGWVDFDPTNNMRTLAEHITLGWGRDYLDVSPTRGFLLGGGTQKLSVSVDVQPIGESL
ncbi:MAG: transglutaminase family protein [Pseudomonadales bacterium]|nr:transglutaminase family protein [Pseudomonadales bacterium]